MTRPPSPRPLAPIPPRVLAALRLWAEGSNADTVGKQMGISAQTARVYLMRAREALGVATTREAIAIARERGLFEGHGTAVTARQAQVLRLAANGHQTVDIARALQISTDTVNSLMGAAYHNLGARDRTQAVAVAIRLGLIQLDEIRVPGAAA